MEQKIVILDEKQFLEIKEDIKTIKKVLENQGNLVPLKRWINSGAAADILNVKIRTLYSYCPRFLHPKKVGGILLFDRSEIEGLIEGKNILPKVNE
jgi:hypothetical protein